MKRILYLTSIPWAWIKQRPQFLAEYLSKNYDVTYCFKRPTIIRKKDLKTNDTDFQSKNLHFKSFRLIPFQNMPIVKRMKLDWVNKLLIKLQIPNLGKYDIIWITSASLYDLLSNKIKNKPNIVYDCMDDILEFPTVQRSEIKRNLLMQKENKLLVNSDIVFCSSDYLKGKIVSRSGISNEKVFVVNNAVELPKVKIQASLPSEISSSIAKIKDIRLCMVYIGTIDKWFDFDSINYVLEKVDGLELVLFGPLRGAIPINPKIHHLGTIQRDFIFDIMDAADILIMPFKLNELIRSVNPVKLYEYIYAGKHIIATKYDETLKFDRFVHLYEDKNELYSIIKNIQTGNYQIDLKENHEYVRNNTWDKRYNIVKNVLDSNFA